MTVDQYFQQFQNFQHSRNSSAPALIAFLLALFLFSGCSLFGSNSGGESSGGGGDTEQT